MKANLRRINPSHAGGLKASAPTSKIEILYNTQKNAGRYGSRPTHLKMLCTNIFYFSGSSISFSYITSSINFTVSSGVFWGN